MRIPVRRHQRETATGKTVTVRAHEREGEGDAGTVPVPEWSRPAPVGSLADERGTSPEFRGMFLEPDEDESWWADDAPEAGEPALARSRRLDGKPGTRQPVTIDGGIARHDTSGNLGVRMLGEHCAGSGARAAKP